jgi:putative drug exporter of the RND superfamily
VVTGRIGRWCARHAWWVLAAWVVLAAAGVLATGPLYSRLADSGIPRDVESVAAYDVINSGNESAGTVVGVVDGIDPAAPEVRRAILDATVDLATLDGVRAVAPTAQAPTPIAEDGRATLIQVTLDDLERSERDAAIREIAGRLHDLAARLPAGATVEVGGTPVLQMQSRDGTQADLSRAEYISLPLTLVVLVVIFGGFVAASLPVLTAALSVAAAMAVMLGFSYVTDVHSDGLTVVTLLGLGLSIDYGLLLVARYREEIAAGAPHEEAVARAWGTAGRTVVFSALTVAAALTGLLMFDLPALTALGSAGVSVAVVCLLASLTVTAALVGLLHRWIKPSRKSLLARLRRSRPQTPRHSTVDEAERGFFARLARGVQCRPVVVALATMIALLAAGAPLVRGELRLPGLDGIPRSIEAARVADTLADRFGQPPAPAITVAAHTDPSTLDAWAARWATDPAIAQVHPSRALDGGLSTVAFDAAGEPQGAAVRSVVEQMRAQRPPGGASWVTGDAAVLSDLLGLLWAGLPAALLVTGAAMLVLLFLMTGSLVVPVKAVLANLVSLGATFGVLTAVFRYGFGADLLDTLTVGSLNPFIVVTIFAFAFGLSMDYEVFLLGRIKEYVDAGQPTDVAVRRGLQHSGRVITSAALLMIIVFSAFAAAQMGMVEQIGLGLTVAVLIDATVVRCLLVPATMTLLGRWNWWAPAGLRRLHARLHPRDLGQLRVVEDQLTRG